MFGFFPYGGIRNKKLVKGKNVQVWGAPSNYLSTEKKKHSRGRGRTAYRGLRHYSCGSANTMKLTQPQPTGIWDSCWFVNNKDKRSVGERRGISQNDTG